MRLIDKDRLLTERMKSKYYHLPNGDIAVPLIDIEHAPAVDAVPVVRCKDCKWCNMGECEHKFGLLVSNDENYCSYGEKDVDI